MSKGGSSRSGAVTAAYITAAATIIAAVITAIVTLSDGGTDNKPSSSDERGSSPPPTSPPANKEPDKAKFTVEVLGNTGLITDTTVTIDGDEIGTIYSHRDPQKLSTSRFSEGSHRYELETILYTPQMEPLSILTGSGDISVEEGKVFRVNTPTDATHILTNTVNPDTVYLQPIN